MESGIYMIQKDPGETVALESKEPKLFEKMVSYYKKYAKEKGIIPVEDSWSPYKTLGH